MKLKKEEKEKLEKMLVNKYVENGFDISFGWNGLGNMIFNDFMAKIEECNENNISLEDICNDITGNYDGSYTYNTYKSAKLIAENIFEFNQAIEDMRAIGYEYNFDIVETEKNLVVVLLFICDMSILALGVETLGELVEKLS